MRVTSLSVSNYKSLREIAWEPGPLTVVIGANASGKSNLADFHDFLADLYRHGLAVAVARKGGYENIAHRKMRRSRGAISVNLSVEVGSAEAGFWPLSDRRSMPDLKFTHSFSFRAPERAIRSDFRIEHESIRLHRRSATGWNSLFEIERTDTGLRHTLFPDGKTVGEFDERLQRMFRILTDFGDISNLGVISSTELTLSSIGRFVPPLRIISDRLGTIQVFQFSLTNAREFGVPIPNPEMDRYGGNLPAVVDMIIKQHPRIWSKIIEIMKQLMAGLQRIDVDYTHYRTLGLYFHEEGVGRPWTVAEISDGTIHSLALLVALYDPRAIMLVLEEPENSVHTWILRTLMQAAKEASKERQIIFTTHSRVVIDAIEPADIWVMWRKNGESNLNRLGIIEEELESLVDEGDLTAFEIIDSGAIPEALPSSPEPDK
jgi:predicted ATPase